MGDKRKKRRKKVVSYKGKRLRIRVNYNKIIEAYKEIFFYGCKVDEWLPEITLMPYLTLQWKLDPTWFRIIAPPGSGKSAHLGILDDYDKTYQVDEFTPKSFVSGFRGNAGEDPSKLQDFDGKVVTISDESTLMEQRQEDRNAVQSILRRAFDGKVTKTFGNIREAQTYKSRFNMLVGSTPTIDRYFLYNQALGERYINYRLQVPNREELAVRAYENQFNDFADKIGALKERVYKFLDSMPKVNITDVKVPDQQREELILCANFIALVRTHITRDSTGTHVTTLPQAESAGRLIKQMTQTAIANAILHGNLEVKPANLERAIYFGVGSVTAVISFILYHIINHAEAVGVGKEASWFSMHQMVIRTALGRRTTQRILEDFAVHRVLEIRDGGGKGGRKIQYSLKPAMYECIKDVKLFDYYNPPFQEVLKLRKKDRVRTLKRKIEKKARKEK